MKKFSILSWAVTLLVMIAATPQAQSLYPVFFTGSLPLPIFNWKTCGDMASSTLCSPSSSTSVLDSSGNGNNGTWHGTQSGTTNWYSAATNLLPYAGYFNGTDNYISGGSSSNINVSTSFTIAAWVNLASTQPQSYPEIFGNYSSTESYYMLYYNNASNYAGCGRTTSSTWNWIEAGPAIKGSWHFIACVYNSITHVQNFYVDGVLGAVHGSSLTNWGPVDTPASNDLEVGGRPMISASKQWMAGPANSICLYPVAFTPAQVVMLCKTTEGSLTNC